MLPMSTCDITVDSPKPFARSPPTFECDSEIGQIVFEELLVTSDLEVRLGASFFRRPNAVRLQWARMGRLKVGAVSPPWVRVRSWRGIHSCTIV